MKINFLLLLFLPLNMAYAQSISIETILSNLINTNISINKYTDDFEAELFKDLKLKIRQISENYSYSQSTFNEIQYISEDGSGCGTTTAGQKTLVGKIIYQDQQNTSKNKLQNLTEFISYTGCDQKPLFQEIYYREGFNLKKLTKKEVLEFKRKLALGEDELAKSYEIRDYQGRSLIKYTLNSFSYSGYLTTKVTISIADQPAIEIIEQKNKERVFITLKLMPFSFVYDFYNNLMPKTFTGNVLLYIDVTLEGEKYYLGANKDLTSKKIFESYYSSYFLLHIYSNIFSSIIKKIITFFPTTEVISRGQNYSKLSRQLEEIRINLINGVDLVKIRQDVEQILVDVLNGTIQDFRPQ